MSNNTSAEQERLDENAKKEVPIELWGSYLSEREWGTVREDYSKDGNAWSYFPHEHARSRAYRWGEDGIGGISDYMQNVCFAIALWNGKDKILKERLFGLSNWEGNHGEDVKELYYYLDNVPSHYYMKYLYKYPQEVFPYDDLINKTAALSRNEPEYEVLDSGVFNDKRYFDVYIEYAKKTSEDVFIKIEICNRGREDASITILPTLWFYNRWQYGGMKTKPSIEKLSNESVHVVHEKLKDYFLHFPPADELLFTENETNYEKLFGKENKTEFVKDAFHEAIIENKISDALRQKTNGTKFAPVYRRNIKGGESCTLFLRLTSAQSGLESREIIQSLFNERKNEADEFYRSIFPKSISPEHANIRRQAMAGLLWNKQYYHYDQERWINNSDDITPVSPERLAGRNHEWKYLKNQDIISMPDNWEYPWYAAWDLAFHAISMAMIDPVFAKNQLLLLMREWYMNPEGQIPAYEWNFGDVNPPVHALAALEVYYTEKKITGKADIEFLKRIFQKLIINFTWWVNRKDANGNNIFEGGFLGLDNIGLFNRNSLWNEDIVLEQTDGTSWMGMYALNMMDIALEIAAHDTTFEDSATKFYEHFVIIAEALNELDLWNAKDNFFYDVLSLPGKDPFQLTIRSIVGLVPLFAVSIISRDRIDKLNDFKKRMDWFRDYRLENKKYLPTEETSWDKDHLLSLVHKDRMLALLSRFLDETEFLAPGGIRALSKFYEQNPYTVDLDGKKNTIQYEPGDSAGDMFGGNSNWRGPVWMPINYLFIKALKKYGQFYGNSLKIECPTGSGNSLTLDEVANEITRRLTSIFIRDKDGNRPVYGHYNWFYKEENADLVLFHEYFHGDNSRGLGASHQTGWTALIANL